MLGFGATGQFAIGEVGPSTAEIITLDKWFQALSQPVRFLPGLRASQQQAFVPPDLFPFVPFSWFNGLSIPALRYRPQLSAGQQQFLAFQPAPSPFVATGWFMALSEPARKLQGLDAARQQFLASPSRLLPNPNITGVLHAVESGDLFTGGGRSWNRVVSGETGIIEQRFTGAEIGAIQMRPSVGTSGLIAQITAPVSGAATPVITKANVSITII